MACAPSRRMHLRFCVTIVAVAALLPSALIAGLSTGNDFEEGLNVSKLLTNLTHKLVRGVRNSDAHAGEHTNRSTLIAPPRTSSSSRNNNAFPSGRERESGRTQQRQSVRGQHEQRKQRPPERPHGSAGRSSQRSSPRGDVVQSHRSRSSGSGSISNGSDLKHMLQQLVDAVRRQHWTEAKSVVSSVLNAIDVQEMKQAQTNEAGFTTGACGRHMNSPYRPVLLFA